DQAFALRPLAGELARAAQALGLLARPFLGGLLVCLAELHLAKHALALQLLLERAQRLVDVVVADEHLNQGGFLLRLTTPERSRWECGAGPGGPGTKSADPRKIGADAPRTGRKPLLSSFRCECKARAD